MDIHILFVRVGIDNCQKKNKKTKTRQRKQIVQIERIVHSLITKFWQRNTAQSPLTNVMVQAEVQGSL